jgi:GT2 family glycosyltransferase
VDEPAAQQQGDPPGGSGSAPHTAGSPAVAVVAIGRNEGERLQRCLDSLVGRVERIVYVDSGSTDDSLQQAHARGVDAVELDMSLPFSAARARNVGLDRLLEVQPDIEFVQFVDGDCEVAEGWMEAALSEIRRHPDAAVVCGRRSERFPERSIYNRLIDMEWDTPVGEARACGGDALMAVDAVRSVGGFDSTMIAGEEPELCVRLRRKGYRILRIDAEMTLHDAAMTRFSQWWRRSIRTGYAYTLGAAMHGASPDRQWVRESLSILFWGAALPTVAVALAWPTHGWSLLLLAAYAVSLLRVAAGRRQHRGNSVSHALLYAIFCTFSKFPQLLGQLRCVWNWLRRQPGALIEYK